MPRKCPRDSRGQGIRLGSSRDWAAKGPRLLGVRAVIAESYERIHRSNLVGMGILPLQFLPGENVETLKLTGEEVVEIAGIREVAEKVSSGRKITVRVKGGRNFRQWCASTLAGSALLLEWRHIAVRAAAVAGWENTAGGGNRITISGGDAARRVSTVSGPLLDSLNLLPTLHTSRVLSAC